MDVVQTEEAGQGFRKFYKAKIEELEDQCGKNVGKLSKNLKRLQAQRNELNAKVRELKEELRLLQEPGSYVGEVVKIMGKKKLLVKVQPEGKYVVELDKSIDLADVKANLRVALRNDSYALHKILPSKVDPLVSLMKVEKVPDSTYDMVGGLDKQVKEIKEVVELPIKHPELFESLGVAQPKVRVAANRALSRAHSAVHSFVAERPLPAGGAAVWPAGHWQDAPGAGCRAPHRLHVHPGVGRRARAEVHRRGLADGARALRDGARARAEHHLHGRGRQHRRGEDGRRQRRRGQRGAADDA